EQRRRGLRNDVERAGKGLGEVPDGSQVSELEGRIRLTRIPAGEIPRIRDRHRWAPEWVGVANQVDAEAHVGAASAKRKDLDRVANRAARHTRDRRVIRDTDLVEGTPERD